MASSIRKLRRSTSLSRRVSSPWFVKHVYNYLKNNKKQQANLTEIREYMQRHHAVSKEICDEEVNFCISDRLLLKKIRKPKANDGANAIFSVPRFVKRDGHDWYCFECHRSGIVKHCASCHRVYHNMCVDKYTENDSCYICNSKTDVSLSKEELNRVLGYVCNRLKKLVPNALKSWKTQESDKLMKALIYMHMDWGTMLQKLSDGKYINLLEFKADIQNILHNVIIYHGANNVLAGKVQKMFEYCAHEIEDIELCVNCYETSNNKVDVLNYLKPCRPPHKLVYAKVDDNPFWPAKVMKCKNDLFEVKFMGLADAKAVVPKEDTIPIIPDVDSLPTFSDTDTWKYAQMELFYHILMINPGARLKIFGMYVNAAGSHPTPDQGGGSGVGKRKRNHTDSGNARKTRIGKANSLQHPVPSSSFQGSSINNEQQNSSQDEDLEVIDILDSSYIDFSAQNCAFPRERDSSIVPQNATNNDLNQPIDDNLQIVFEGMFSCGEEPNDQPRNPTCLSETCVSRRVALKMKHKALDFVQKSYENSIFKLRKELLEKINNITQHFRCSNCKQKATVSCCNEAFNCSVLCPMQGWYPRHSNTPSCC